MKRSLQNILALAACFVLACAASACGRAAAGVGSSAVAPSVASQKAAASQKAEGGEGRPADDRVNGEPLKLPLVRPRVVVTKSARRLVLYDGERAVRTYRVGLGTAPEGDKVRAGDRRTPHGSFYVCVKNARSAFYLSLGLSYPNEEDAERGLRDGLITRAQHRKIVSAIKRKQTPPWDTALGGEIFIHGNGSQTDWTWGCVALEDADIKELFDAVPVGTEVRIEP